MESNFYNSKIGSNEVVDIGDDSMFRFRGGHIDGIQSGIRSYLDTKPVIDDTFHQELQQLLDVKGNEGVDVSKKVIEKILLVEGASGLEPSRIIMDAMKQQAANNLNQIDLALAIFPRAISQKNESIFNKRVLILTNEDYTQELLDNFLFLTWTQQILKPHNDEVSKKIEAVKEAPVDSRDKNGLEQTEFIQEERWVETYNNLSSLNQLFLPTVNKLTSVCAKLCENSEVMPEYRESLTSLQKRYSDLREQLVPKGS